MDESKKLYSMNEIIELLKINRKTVTKKIEQLKIKPAEKEGNKRLYSSEDVERIKNHNPMPYNPKTVFYRVSVLEGNSWIVKNAGLTKKQAEKKVKFYARQGYLARSLCCKTVTLFN